MKLSDFKYDELKKRVEEMNIKKKLKDLTFEEFAEWARKKGLGKIRKAAR